MIGWVVCNEYGLVIMYVDIMIDLMQVVMDEIVCCCVVQMKYNEDYYIMLYMIKKVILELIVLMKIIEDVGKKDDFLEIDFDDMICE